MPLRILFSRIQSGCEWGRALAFHPSLQAFRALSLLYHPDVVGGAADAAAAHAKFVRLSVAYHTLIDPQRRAKCVSPIRDRRGRFLASARDDNGIDPVYAAGPTAHRPAALHRLLPPTLAAT